MGHSPEEGEEKRGQIPPSQGAGNVRIMVPDADAMYEKCRKLGHPIHYEIGDRLFVLRDFIVLDPDGFEVRFGSYLEGRRSEQFGGAAHNHE